MKIVQLTPGSGGTFYCENCLRDAALLRQIRSDGHDVLMVPLYLPIAPDAEAGVARSPIFYGGINVYLQQVSALFGRTPHWLDRLLDAPALLRWVGKRASMTNPKVLAETTISMLAGEDGRQVKELNRLAAWLKEAFPADVVCLSNALLLGLAGRLRRELNAPVVCLLQDEDIFLDDLPEPYRQRAWRLLADKARQADHFIAVSEYYRRAMIDRLQLPGGKVSVVETGLDSEPYAPAEHYPPEEPAIGFLERMCPQKGLDTLIEAFGVLKSSGRFGSLKLRICGGKTAADEPFLADCRRRLAEGGWAGDAEFVEDFSRDGRIAFLRGLSVLSVPARHGEAFGLYVLESLACGVPVVLPPVGAFDELLAATGGGVLAGSDAPEDLAAGLAKLLDDTELARRLGHQGRQAVGEKFSIRRSAEKFTAVCRGVCDNLSADSCDPDAAGGDAS